MAQVRPVTSETLEAQIRDLLPSQNGFTEDLQASNVITPIIDLTSVAEGTSTPRILQTAMAFGSNTSFTVQNTTTTVANTPGFYRILGTGTVENPGSTTGGIEISISNGLTSKIIYGINQSGVSPDNFVVASYDFVVFLRAGDSFTVKSDNTSAIAEGSVRQIADVNGNLVQPSGFTPQ